MERKKLKGNNEVYRQKPEREPYHWDYIMKEMVQLDYKSLKCFNANTKYYFV